MRLEWLEDILAVAKTGSFTEAAGQRHLTASAFSRRIQMIEAAIGIQLFERSRKPVQLRPTIADQRDRIERLAADLRQLVQDLRQGDIAAGNRITLVSQHALSAALTPALVERIHHQNSDLYLRLRSANQDECFALLLSQQAQIALVYRLSGSDHAVDADYIETTMIGSDILLPVISTAQLPQMRESLANGVLRVIAYPRDVFLGEIIERHLYPTLWTRCRIASVAETALTLAAKELAVAGLGVAWLPKSLADDKLSDGRLADLSDFLPTLGLDVTSVRLKTRKSAVENAVWGVLNAPSSPPL
jgi:LysR family transcriptional regulator, hypochlorite-specific transcription factor HypT